ncbi:MAG: hypothetical protein OXS28_05840 [Gammaproteobacteria bacterium]|nr:hypothetical protein [Gammaproteobacteria bacterium]
MSVMVKEIFEAFVEAGTSRETATAAAAVVPVTDNLATKTDLAELRKDMANMEIRLIKWMVSLQLATLVMIAGFIKFL